MYCREREEPIICWIRYFLDSIGSFPSEELRTRSPEDPDKHTTMKREEYMSYTIEQSHSLTHTNHHITLHKTYELHLEPLNRQGVSTSENKVMIVERTNIRQHVCVFE